jgi:hypothetical protein
VDGATRRSAGPGTLPGVVDRVHGRAPGQAHGPTGASSVVLPYLDPHLLLLWRSAGVLQIGLDPAHAVAVEGAPADLPAALRLLDGLTPAEHLLSAGLPAPAGPALAPVVQMLEDGRLLAEGAPLDAWRQAWVHVAGAGPVAAAAVSTLRSAGVGRCSLDEDSAPGRPDLVVVAPARGRGLELANRLVAGGTAHLCAHVRDGRAIVGPLVVPGASSCLRCHDLHRTEADPAWPRLAIAWEQTEPWSLDTVAAELAGTLAARQALRWLQGVPVATLDATLEEQPDGALAPVLWPAHSGCGCCWGLAGWGQDDGR